MFSQEASSFLVPEKPNGYSLKKVEEITSKYISDTVDPNKKRPNVIAVINEAFSDPQVLEILRQMKDYMPFIHDLMKNGNCVSGTTLCINRRRSDCKYGI